MASSSTFGSYARFDPHVHALVTEGVFARDRAFPTVAWPPSGVLEEAFRRLVRAALVRAEPGTHRLRVGLTITAR